MAIIDNFNQQQLENIVKESHSYKEVIQKLGYKTTGGNTHQTVKKRLQQYNIDTSHFSTRGAEAVERNEQNVFCLNSTASQATLRRWYIKGEYTPYVCDCCGISEWQGQKIVLQLDHKNGDNHDNRLENLHWLCPNCHSQTDTFCGKQLKKNHITKNGVSKEKPKYFCIDCGIEISADAKRCPICAAKARRTVNRPSKEELYQFLIDNKGNFCAAGRYYGVTDNAIRKWCDSYKLSRKSNDYKNP